MSALRRLQDGRGPRRPRLHWVSPIPPAKTDIAGYTGRVLRALDAHADVVLWTDGGMWDRDLEGFAEIRRFDGETGTLDLSTLPPGPGGPEPIFLHMGNSWVFHTGILRLAQRYPALVVLHDAAIHESLRDAVSARRLRRADYLDMVAAAHGPEARAEAAALPPGPTPWDVTARLPMVPAVLARAVAVLCHTRAAEAAAAPRPTWRLDLPYAVSPEAPPAARAADGPLRLAQFGHIGPNRGLEVALEALAGLEGVDWRFDLFGAVWDPARIEARIRDLRLSGRVHVRGFAPEAELDAALRDAHLVFNLRNPTMGEASGSQLRIWNASAAAAVTDLGWYADLPEGTVFKVPPEAEVEGLRAVIRRLDADRGTGSAVGAAGRAALEASHRAETYAVGIARIAAAWPDLCAAAVARAALDRAAARSPMPDALRALTDPVLTGRG